MAFITDDIDSYAIEQYPGAFAKNAKPYMLSWKLRNLSPIGQHFVYAYAYNGTLDEVKEALEELATLGDQVVCVELEQNPTVRIQNAIEEGRGHIHFINGKLDDHRWEDCPENRNSPNFGKELTDVEV